MKKLTIGMATYDDFDGVFFTIQSIRMHHPDVIESIEFLIVDNNPLGAHGDAIKKYIHHIRQPVQYIPFTEYASTAVRNTIFSAARTPYVMSTDSHVLFVPGSLRKLIDFYENNLDGGNLLQGPLLYDDLFHISTHFDLVWRSQMWGTWGTDQRGIHPNNPPFEIPAQGLGVFSCRKDYWLGFNPHFRGFGGEEGYIHEKYRKSGKKTLCLPFLQWMHRFGRPNGIKYPLTIDNKIRNYFLGHIELNMDVTPIIEHFKEFVPMEKLEALRKNAEDTLNANKVTV